MLCQGARILRELPPTPTGRFSGRISILIPSSYLTEIELHTCSAAARALQSRQFVVRAQIDLSAPIYLPDEFRLRG